MSDHCLHRFGVATALLHRFTPYPTARHEHLCVCASGPVTARGPAAPETGMTTPQWLGTIVEPKGFRVETKNKPARACKSRWSSILFGRWSGEAHSLAFRGHVDASRFELWKTWGWLRRPIVFPSQWHGVWIEFVCLEGLIYTPINIETIWQVDPHLKMYWEPCHYLLGDNYNLYSDKMCLSYHSEDDIYWEVGDWLQVDSASPQLPPHGLWFQAAELFCIALPRTWPQATMASARHVPLEGLISVLGLILIR